MKKIIAMLLAVVMVAAVFAGCAPATKPAGTTAAKPAGTTAATGNTGD